jgi:predicted TIM-barrel fold metal-dependent hydrolase
MKERRQERRQRRRQPRRRDILAGSLALAALGPRRIVAAEPAPATLLPPLPAGFEVDVHCHSFSTADLPVVGFVAHYIPGLSDITRELTHWPELVIREILRLVTKLPDAVVPKAADELAALQKALTTGETIPSMLMIPDEVAAGILGKALKYLPFSIGDDTRTALARYVTTLYTVTHARGTIAATMVDTYGSVSLFTPCLVDYDEWSDDRAPTPLADQIAIQTLVSKLAARQRIKRNDVRIHPFVAFDPAREVKRKLPSPDSVKSYRPFGDPRVFDENKTYACVTTPAPAITADSGAIEMVRHAVEAGGFLGVKMYPPVGFAPLDNASLRPTLPTSPRLDLALRALYAYCEAEEIPITAHTSAGNEYGLGFRDLVSPDRWIPVLKAYPNLRLNMGHYGHEYGVDRFQGVNACEAWIRQASALIQAYPNVYADLSNSPLAFDAGYRLRYIPYLRDILARFPKVRKRLMYGSDWWLNRLQAGSDSFALGIRGALSDANAAAKSDTKLFSPDEISDIMGRNALRFLGLLDDNNRPRSGRATARLRQFYADAQGVPPIWLPH